MPRRTTARRAAVPAALALSLVAGLAAAASAQEKPNPAVAPPKPAVAPTVAPTTLDPHNHAPAPAAAAVADFPLKFEHTSFDFGNIPDTEKVTHVFKFTNGSDHAVKIASVNGSCGCTVPTLSKTDYAPGEAGEITATFDPSNRVGHQPKTITVTLADSKQLVLNLSSTVKPYVYLDQPKVHFSDILKGTESTQSLNVYGRAADFTVTGIDVPDADNSAFTVVAGEPEPFQDGDETLRKVPIKISIKPGLKAGVYNAQFSVKTSDTRKPALQAYASAQVVGEVRCQPPVMFIRQNQPSLTFETTAQIDNRLGKPFEITAVDVEGPAEMSLIADFEATSGGDGRPAYTVKVAGVTPPLPGQYRGTVTVSTNVPEEDDIKVLFYCNVLNTNGQLPSAMPSPVALPANSGKAVPTPVPTTSSAAPHVGGGH